VFVQKTFVLDTCVLLSDPYAIYQFDEHHVVLPLTVIEELDGKKTRMDEVGANARSVLRLLDSLGASDQGGMSEAVDLPNGGSLRIELNRIESSRMPVVLDPTKPDHRILATCLNLSDDGRDAVLVTKDTALRIKGAQLQLAVEDYRADTAQVDELYSGMMEVEVHPEAIDHLFLEGKLVLTGVQALVNQFVLLRAGQSRSAMARVKEISPETVVTRVVGGRSAFGVEPKNLQQTYALDLLLDPDIPAVSLMGMAGAGKTFLALAAGLEQVLERETYRKVSVYRPMVAVGRQEMGYLPGDLEEKLSPWMAAVHDNLQALFSNLPPEESRDVVEDLMERGEIEMASVTYLRGRSITGEFVIIDEAQNLELSTLKVILTRMGKDSKVVLCGDLSQVDNPYISPYGGMAAMIEKFKGNAMFGHVTLQRSLRSPLAEAAATML
jgi:PhoH-like ATPase